MAIADMAYIDDTGYHYADYPTVLEYFKTSFKSIYGADVYLEPDSQDGEGVALIAQAVYDCIAMGAATYNSFSPSTAAIDALSRNVKINGIRRKLPGRSSVDVIIVGQAGTIIQNGQVGGTDDIRWDLPESVLIPPNGTITVTALASIEGAIQAAPGSITKILTPTRGWQTVTNPNNALGGNPVESAAELRVRQSQSVALPSRTVFEGILGAVAGIPGVTRFTGDDNDTKVTNANGTPGNHIWIIAEGGSANEIAAAIGGKKTPGGGTFGTTAITITNVYGLPQVIRFGRPIYRIVTAKIGIKPLSGYSVVMGQDIQEAVSRYINNVQIGGGLSGSVEWADAITAANSIGGGINYKVTSLVLYGPDGPGNPDLDLAFNYAAQATPEGIELALP